MLGVGGFLDVTSGSPLRWIVRPSRYRRVARGVLALGAATGELSRFTGVSPQQNRAWLHDLRHSPSHASEVATAYRRVFGRPYSDHGRVAGPTNEMLYLFLRATRPRVVVETGVHYGFSSSYLLRALHDNGEGHLWSIDLPITNPEGMINQDGRRDRTHVDTVGETGAVIPDRLRDRWTLILGPSDPELTRLLPQVGPVDVFFHDSDHSRAAMLWEYRTAWPFILPGGTLLSDDVDWHDAFDTFTREVGAPSFRWFGPEGRRAALRKPALPSNAVEREASSPPRP